jgi:hypothetical protein
MENNNSKIAVAIIAGIAAGAAAWYFMTTENGKHNWATLIDIAKDITDKLKDAGSEQGSFLASAGREASEYVGRKASDAFDGVKSYQ